MKQPAEDLFSINDLYTKEALLPKQVYSGPNLDDVLKVEEYSSHTPMNQQQQQESDDLKLPNFSSG